MFLIFVFYAYIVVLLFHSNKLVCAYEREREKEGERELYLDKSRRMEETRRNSMKLDIEAVRLSDNDRDQPTETYKKSSEFDSNEKSPGK